MTRLIPDQQHMMRARLRLLKCRSEEKRRRIRFSQAKACWARYAEWAAERERCARKVSQAASSAEGALLKGSPRSGASLRQCAAYGRACQVIKEQTAAAARKAQETAQAKQTMLAEAAVYLQCAAERTRETEARERSLRAAAHQVEELAAGAEVEELAVLCALWPFTANSYSNEEI